MLIIKGIAPFMLSVLMEGTPRIQSYEPAPASVVVTLHSKDVPIDFSVAGKNREGRMEYWDFVPTKKGRPEAWMLERAEAIEKLESEGSSIYLKFDESKLKRQAIAFDNWLVLCAAITRCRQVDDRFERETLSHILDTRGEVRLSELLAESQIERAVMLSVLAKELQLGRLKTDLDTRLLTNSSMISGG